MEVSGTANLFASVVRRGRKRGGAGHVLLCALVLLILAGKSRSIFLTQVRKLEIAMKKFVAVALGLSLMVGGAFAKLTVEVMGVGVPGVNSEGGPDTDNPGLVGGKVKVNENTGAFSAKLKGTAPNDSGKKAKLTVPYMVEVETPFGPAVAAGDADAKYSKPKSKLEGDSAVKVKAKGIADLL